MPIGLLRISPSESAPKRHPRISDSRGCQNPAAWTVKHNSCSLSQLMLCSPWKLQRGMTLDRWLRCAQARTAADTRATNASALAERPAAHTRLCSALTARRLVAADGSFLATRFSAQTALLSRVRSVYACLDSRAAEAWRWPCVSYAP